MFKRSSVKYGETPAPETPYQRAQAIWDERIGSSRAQAANWRLAAFGSLIIALLAVGGLLWRSTQSIVTPYVVEVEAAGTVRAVGPAVETYNYAREHDPFAEIGRRSVNVEVTSVVRASDDSFEVRWTEKTYTNGQFERQERFTAHITIVLSPPRTAEAIHKNPLGIYVHGINWSKDLS